MSVKIRVSYTDNEELYEVIRRLMPVFDIRIQPAKGRFKRAYIDLKGVDKDTLLVREKILEAAKIL